MLMCTFPRKDWSFEKSGGKGNTDGVRNLLNEVMNGFEYQVAGHMIWEGMVQQGLAVTRAVHDRHHPSKRNPWNEVECGDHYSRSMASYGVFIAACGFEYHGPKQHIGFAPKLTPENFKCAFISAEGWGSFSQKIAGGRQTASLALKWGSLRLRTISLATSEKPGSATVKVGDKITASSLSWRDGKVTIMLINEVLLTAGQFLGINLSK